MFITPICITCQVVPRAANRSLKTTKDISAIIPCSLCFLLMIISDVTTEYFSAPQTTHKGIYPSSNQTSLAITRTYIHKMAHKHYFFLLVSWTANWLAKLSVYTLKPTAKATLGLPQQLMFPFRRFCKS